MKQKQQQYVLMRLPAITDLKTTKLNEQIQKMLPVLDHEIFLFYLRLCHPEILLNETLLKQKKDQNL